MNPTNLHTVATAVAFGVGTLCVLGGTALACLPQLGGTPDPALLTGAAFLTGSGLIQWQRGIGTVAAVVEPPRPAPPSA